MSVLPKKPMRKSRFTEEQIVAVLHEVEAGAKIAEVCQRHGITDTTFSAGAGNTAVSRSARPNDSPPLEEENRQLKRLVAEQALNLQVAKGLVGKIVVTPRSGGRQSRRR